VLQAAGERVKASLRAAACGRPPAANYDTTATGEPASPSPPREPEQSRAC